MKLGWSTANKLKSASNFIDGRPNAALLFWFFGGFRCGVWLCFVILLRYKKKRIGKNQLMQLCTACTAWSDSDQAVRAVHSCNS